MIKYYFRAVLLPTLVAMTGTMIYLWIDYGNYESEWFNADDVVWITFIMHSLYCGLLCVLALPIFLNRLQVFKSNWLLCALSWLLLPGICLVISVYQILHHWLENEPYGIFWGILIVPFLISFPWSFIRFRLSRKQG